MEYTDSLDKQVSIYQRARPVRVAYLIQDGPESGQILDNIFSESYSRWGGRRTLIIPVNEGELAENYSKWLEWYEPDIVYSFVKLEQNLFEYLLDMA